MRPLALKWRVVLCAALTLIATVVLISVLAYAQFRALLLRHIDDALTLATRGTAAAVDGTPDPEEAGEVKAIMGPMAHEHPFAFRIWLDGKPDMYASDPATEESKWLQAAIAERRPPEPEQQIAFGEGIGENAYRAVWLRYKTPAGMANIVTAQFGHFDPKELHAFLMVLVPMTAIIILLAIGAILWLVNWALRPVHTTAAEIRGVTAKNVGDVQLGSYVPAELDPIVTAVSAMLVRLDRAIASQKRFVADVSHELRTPLALAKSTLQAARVRDRELTTYKQMADDTLADLARMERLIEEMLTLAKLDESDAIPQAGEVELRAVLEQAASSVCAAQPQLTDRLSCNLAKAQIWGNKDQLARVFTNLLENAVKYGPPEGKILLSATVGDREATIIVHDEGGQIPAEDIPKVFERFVRLDRSRSNTTGGAGLGLSIAREIVVRHKGTICISSTPQAGTSLAVRLPLSSKSAV